MGVCEGVTHFYNKDGSPSFTHYLRIWFQDSIAIEKITGVNMITDTLNIQHVSYPVILYRYINLRTKTIYDYKNLSDTAKIIHKAVLPDSLMTDYGWSFYSEKNPRIVGTPELLSDTVIDNVNYKRIKFVFERDDPQKTFLIGYFICDGRQEMFSLEKIYSRKLNCSMIKFFQYNVGSKFPFASKEINSISNTLSNEMINIFKVWQKNEEQNPVTR
jgi:hypothetical protein